MKRIEDMTNKELIRLGHWMFDNGDVNGFHIVEAELKKRKKLDVKI